MEIKITAIKVDGLTITDSAECLSDAIAKIKGWNTNVQMLSSYGKIARVFVGNEQDGIVEVDLKSYHIMPR